jgi:hypothetical protein
MTAFQSNEHVKAFFLNLAAKGKDEWNAWRHISANAKVPVTFAGIDFSEAPRDEINFSGFEFGDHADFSRCKWRGVRSRKEKDPTVFEPGRAFFRRAVFGHDAASSARPSVTEPILLVRRPSMTEPTSQA